jgi:hypothetical protein
MQTFILSRRFATAAALVVSALTATSTAQARTDVTFSIGIHVPGVQVHRAPVIVAPPRAHQRPRTVYVQPRPVYVQPRPVVVQRHPVFVQPPVYRHSYGKRDHWNRFQGRRAQQSMPHGHGGQHGGKHGGHRH